MDAGVSAAQNGDRADGSVGKACDGNEWVLGRCKSRCPLPVRSNRFTTARGGGSTGALAMGAKSVIGLDLWASDEPARPCLQGPGALAGSGDLRGVVRWDDAGAQKFPSSGPALPS